MNSEADLRALLQEMLWWWESDQHHMSEYHGKVLMNRVRAALGQPTVAIEDEG